MKRARSELLIMLVVVLLVVLAYYAFEPKLPLVFADGSRTNCTQLEKAYLDLSKEYNKLTLKDFQTEKELADFLMDDLAYTRNYDVNLSPCIQKAEALQKRALKQGRLLNIDVITAAEYLKWYGKESIDSHIVCSIVVNHKLYYIEPSDNHYWQAYYWN